MTAGCMSAGDIGSGVGAGDLTAGCTGSMGAGDVDLFIAGPGATGSAMLWVLAGW